MSRAAPWKPLWWIIALDLAGCLVLGLGLHAHYAPGATVVAQAMAPVRLPLLVLGALMLAAGTVLVLRLVLRLPRLPAQRQARSD